MAPVTQHRKWLEKVAREGDRAKLKNLRDQVRDKRSDRRKARSKARAVCASAKRAVREYGKKERQRLRDEAAALRLELPKRKAAAGRTCAALAGEAGRAGLALGKAQQRLEDERAEQAREKRWSRKTPPTAARKLEVRQESDSQVLAELSPEEAIVWRSVGSKMKATGRMSRHEAFVHWLHEHPGDVQVLLAKHYDRELAQLVKAETMQRAKTGGSYKRHTSDELRERVRGALADVPF